MQNTSKLYQDIIAGDHWFETRLCIGDTGVLIEKSGDAITFGGVRILVAASGPDAGYGENMLVSMSAKKPLFSGTPTVGNTCAGEIEVSIVKPHGEIPKRALLAPYVRATDGSRVSEWIPKGKYYIDKRSESEFGNDALLTLHGYDGMLFAEADYPSESQLDWPAKDIKVVEEIASDIGVGIDSRVYEIVKNGYAVQYPAGYSEREVLGYIGSMYAGNWCMNDSGELMLIPLAGLPKETRYLIVGGGDSRAITFGGVRIFV